MTSPPRYTSSKETSFSRSTFGIGGSSHRNEYEALPLSDEQLSLEEEQRTSIINCKTNGFAIYIKQKDIRDVEHLESFIRQYEPSFLPSFSLRIMGFRSPRSDESAAQNARDEQKFQIFNFTVPLPSSIPSSRKLIYAKAHDVPCLRGKLEDSQLLYFLGEQGWTSRAIQGSQVYDVVTRQPLQASSSAKEKWDSRRQKMTKPWLRLSENTRDTFLSEQEERKNAERTLKSNLSAFLKCRSRAKWLILPQTTYGWSLPLALGEIRSLIPEEAPSSTSSDNQAVPPYIKIQIDAPPPFLAIRVLSSSSMLLHSMIGDLSGFKQGFVALTVILLACVILFDFVVILLWLGKETVISWGFWLVNILSFSLLGSLLFLQENNRVFDSVGLAWNLKAVGEENQDKGGNSSVDSEAEEKKWVEKHSNLLRRAIKERRTGNLRSEWPEDD